MSWYNSNRRNSLPSNWPAIRNRALADAGYLCAKCGAAATDVDHIRPDHEGGGHEPSNLQALCATCHKKKTQAEARAAKARYKAEATREIVHPLDAKRKKAN